MRSVPWAGSKAQPRRECWHQGVFVGLALATAVLLAAYAARRAQSSPAWDAEAWPWHMAPDGSTSCPALLRVLNRTDTCALYYRPRQGRSKLRCTYFDNRVTRNMPCKFNVSRLACVFPTSTQLGPVPQPRCGLGAATGVPGSAGLGWQAKQAGKEDEKEVVPVVAAAAAAAADVPAAAAAAVDVPAAAAAAADVPAASQAQGGAGSSGTAPAAANPAGRVLPLSLGSWAPPRPLRGPGWQPGLAFHPAGPLEDLHPVATSAIDLVGWARATGIRRIVVSGDSTMRQFFQRVITLSRAQFITTDMAGQRFGHYEICEEGAVGGGSRGGGGGGGRLRDSLWFSEMFKGAGAAAGTPFFERHNASALAELVARTSGADASVGCSGAPGTPAPELAVDLVVGCKWDFQIKNMRAYLRQVVGTNPAVQQETALVLAVCYWHRQEEDSQLWPEYRAFLWEAAAYARRLLLLTCPLPPKIEGGPAVLAARNAELAALVAGDGSGKLQLLDAAAMAASLPAEATLADFQYHYACMFTMRGRSKLVAYRNYDGEGGMWYFNRVRVPRAGHCEDPMNFALWQAALRLLGQD